jgi:hypothetical protein
MLAPGSALSIHARFRSTDGVIEQLPAPVDAGSANSAQEAQRAEEWYRGIVSDAFAA